MDSAPPVVVLGSTGTIGASLCSYLGRDGIPFLAVPRSRCDLLDAQATRQLVRDLPPGCTVVFTAVINRWKDDSFQALAGNLAMVEHFAEPARGRIGSLIYLSSVDVYGRSPALPIHEGTRPEPESYYAIAKYAAERLLLRALAPHCPVTLLRLPGVYGKDGGERSILGSFLKKVLYGEPITVLGDGSVLRDFVFVDDVCDLILRLARAPRPGTLNVATGTSLPLLEVLATLGRVLGKQPILQFAPPSGASAGDLVFDVAGLGIAFPDWTATPLAAGSAILAGRIRS